MGNAIEKKKIPRRAFLRRSAGVAAGVAATTAPLPGLRQPAAALSETGKVNADNETLTMLHDLQQALQKPIEQRRWAMVIDTRKCIGCNACSVACIAENNLPPGVTYRIVDDAEDGDYPKLQRYFMPTNCMQCQNAPCIEAANKVIPG